MIVLSSEIVSVVRVFLVLSSGGPEKKKAEASLLFDILRPSFLMGANGSVTKRLALQGRKRSSGLQTTIGSGAEVRQFEHFDCCFTN